MSGRLVLLLHCTHLLLYNGLSRQRTGELDFLKKTSFHSLFKKDQLYTALKVTPDPTFMHESKKEDKTEEIFDFIECQLVELPLIQG